MAGDVGPELVIGLVGAVGCDLPVIADIFVTALSEVNYEAVPIRLSHLLHDLEPYAHIANVHDQEQYISGHMDAGNNLRERTTNDVMARLGVVRIRIARQHDTDEDSENQPHPRPAYILNSLKRPEEVTKLREIYGGAFFLVSAYASRDRRREAPAARIAKSKNLESAAPGRVLFEPFVGIAPPRFRDFFLMPDRKDENGRIISWDEIKRSALPRIESDPRSYIRSERVAVEELGRALADAGVKIRETTN